MTTNQRRKRVSMSVSCYVDDKMLRSSFYCNHVRKGWKETYSYKINTVTNSNSTRCFPTAYIVIPVSGPIGYGYSSALGWINRAYCVGLPDRKSTRLNSSH